MLQTLATSHDKSSKKSWSQRLKITKNDKQSPAPPSSAPAADDEHVRPRSLKYAEPMYFGTVRGDGRPINLTNPAQFYAPVTTVVLCSCPDYLHGTKKDAKKPTLCKKCRGTRVPLAQFGGTVRLHATAPLMGQPMRTSIGTVRLPPGVNASSGSVYGLGKQRPSILGGQAGGGGNESSDPYDMMRRSRLVSPELQPVNNVLKHHQHTTTATADGTNAKSKSRAKSTSPLRVRRSRSRSRTRRSPSPPTPVVAPVNNAHRNGCGSSGGGGGWVTENELNDADHSTNASRRSILHCDLSAYELITKISHNNEFAPMADDDDLYSMLPMMLSSPSPKHVKAPPEHSPPLEYGHNGNGLDVTALAGQRMNFSPLKVPQNGSSADCFVYDRVGYATASDGSNAGSPKSPGRRHTATLSPVRPPRVNQRKSAADSAKASSTIDSDASESLLNGDFMLTSSVLTHISNDIMPHTSQPAIVIKSILKRPSSIASDSQPSSLSVGSGSDVDYGRTSSTNPANDPANVRSAKGKVSIALSKNTLHGPAAASALSAAATSPTAPTITSTAAAASATALSAASGRNANMTSISPTKEKRSSGSHFYLPMPQRKKVQFSEDTNSAAAASGTVEEAYFGEHDQRHLHDGGGDVDHSSPATTHMFAYADEGAALPLVSASAAADLLIGGAAAIQHQHMNHRQQQQQHSNYTVAHGADYAAAATPKALSTHVMGMGLDTVGSAAGVTFVTAHATASATAAVIEIIPPAIDRPGNAGNAANGTHTATTTATSTSTDDFADFRTPNYDGNH